MEWNSMDCKSGIEISTDVTPQLGGTLDLNSKILITVII